MLLFQLSLLQQYPLLLPFQYYIVLSKIFRRSLAELSLVLRHCYSKTRLIICKASETKCIIHLCHTVWNRKRVDGWVSTGKPHGEYTDVFVNCVRLSHSVIIDTSLQQQASIPTNVVSTYMNITTANTHDQQTQSFGDSTIRSINIVKLCLHG